MRKLFLAVVMSALTACATSRAPQAEREAFESAQEEAVAGQRVLLVSNLPDLIFGGTVRKDAKLTMVTSSTINYSSITAVTTLTKPVVNSSSPRTGVETNQAKFSAYLYAYNLPADNDFHLLIGDTPTFQTGVTNLINVEVSGRPNSSDTVFRAVRTAFLSKVGNPSTLPYSTYTCIPTPILITVTGGPFWDTAHPSGGSGTSTCGGKTIKTINGWELHPVTTIQ